MTFTPVHSPSATGPAANRTDTNPLHDHLSARKLLGRGQAVLGALALAAFIGVLALHGLTGLGPTLVWWGQLAVGLVTGVYVLVIGFKLALVLSAGGAPVLRFDPQDLDVLRDEALPSYTVLVPLHREGAVLPHLLERLADLDYPQERLQVLLLIEEDDEETQGALARLSPGPQFHTVIIPPEGPRTKPKACNIGLRQAVGEFCVIFDAEDRPERDQLRKAVLAFRSLPDRVVCVQAELQYWNPWTNWLTQCFAAEYATNFSLSLRGLDRFRLAIPLGGTSNHFRTDALRRIGAWDPYNVTEDADLGIRIARRGWEVRMMVSVTEEEANSRLGNWIRQRSRWIKGYFQTWLVHMRHPWRLWRELGPRRFLGFQLTLGLTTVTTLVNPLFWAMTSLYLATGTRYIAALFPGPTLYAGVATMVVGNLLMGYCLMAGCMERRLYRAVLAVLGTPIYWALMSVAAYKAFVQLLRPKRRHYWELTVHGLVEQESDLASSGSPQP